MFLNLEWPAIVLDVLLIRLCASSCSKGERQCPPRPRPANDSLGELIVAPSRGALTLKEAARAPVAMAAFAAGALAMGALAIGAVAIGSLVIGRARVKSLVIDELVIRRRDPPVRFPPLGGSAEGRGGAG